jgi:hypothetical protein
MSRLSGHLSQLGTLLVAVVAAAVAYSIYDAGSPTSNTGARTPVAGQTADFGAGPLARGPEGREHAKHLRESSVGRTADDATEGASHTEAARASGAGTGPQGAPSEAQLQDVSVPLTPHVSAPLQHISTPLPQRPGHTGVPRRGDDRGQRRGRDHERGRPRGPFDDRALDRELHRLIGDRPLPRIPKGPAEDIPTELPPELIKGPGVPAPKPTPEPPSVPGQPVVSPSPTPVAPALPSPAQTNPPVSAPGEATPDEDADSGSSEDEADDTDTGTTTPPPAPTEPAPVPVDPDDQTGNADDEDAGMDDQGGEAEDESPVPPGGSEGADDGVAGDGDDAVASPVTVAPPATGGTADLDVQQEASATVAVDPAPTAEIDPAPTAEIDPAPTAEIDPAPTAAPAQAEPQALDADVGPPVTAAG